MKPLHHHVQRLAARLLQAEQLNDPREAEHVLRKAKKHEEKISRWHHKLSQLNLWNR